MKKKSIAKAVIHLDDYERMVGTIADRASGLSEGLLGQWPRAKAAGDSAVTMRVRVAACFPSTEGEDSHEFFLNRLRDWLGKLQQTPVLADFLFNKVKAQADGIDFSNYYEVLALPDDFFGSDTALDSSSPGVSTKEGPRSKSTTSSWERKFEEAFSRDLDIELGCLLVELEELVEGVYSAYYDVKREKKTLLEAAVVAKVATDCSATVIAKLQVRYPAIRTAEDLIYMIEDRIDDKTRSKMWDRACSRWSLNTSHTYQYKPGSLLIDLTWVERALMMFAWLIRDGELLPTRSKIYGELYDEDKTQKYVVPDPFGAPAFLLQQLPLLYNEIVQHPEQYDTRMLSSLYLNMMQTYFKTKSASIQVLFSCVLWLRAVTALQGDKCIGRNASLVVTLYGNIHDRVHASILKQGDIDKESELPLQRKLNIRSNAELNFRPTPIINANPLMAGYLMFDGQFTYGVAGIESLRKMLRMNGFCHIYSALRDHELIDTNLFLEKIAHLTIYLQTREKRNGH